MNLSPLELLFGGAVLSFWGWLAIQVVGMRGRIVALEAKMDARETECDNRLTWLRSVETKIDGVACHTAKICGKLGIND